MLKLNVTFVPDIFLHLKFSLFLPTQSERKTSGHIIEDKETECICSIFSHSISLSTTFILC